MPNFTNQELTDIVLCYGASGNNALQAQRSYQQMFPNRHVPDVRTFVSTVQRLRDYGSFAPRVHDRGRTRSRRVMDAEVHILEAVEDDPSLSTRRLAHQVGVSQFTASKTLREQGLYEQKSILADADLSSTSAKKVRQELEEKLEANLQSRKKEIDDLVMEFVNSKQEKKKGKKSESEGEEDEEEEEEESEEDKKEKRASTGKKPPAKKAKKSSEDDSASEQSEGDSEEEYSPKKSKPIKTRKLPPKKKKGSESDSDEDWAKSKKGKKGNSDETDETDGDRETVKTDFNHELLIAFRRSQIPLTTLEHPLLKQFFSKYCGKDIPDLSTLIEQYGEIDSGSDDSNDEGGGGGKKGGSGYTKSLTLSPELAALVGKSSMARHEVVQKVWAIIKEKDLYDPKNKQYAICDDALMKVIGVKRFRTFGMMKYLKNHFKS